MDRRRFVASGAAVLAGTAIPKAAGARVLRPADEPTVSVQRLTWAGVRFEHEGTALFVDPLITDIWDGKGSFPQVPLVPGERRTYALITHLHNDHYDPAALKEILGERGRVFCHRGIAAEISSEGFRVRDVDLHEPVRLGGFTVSAVPAVDGFGVRGGQVSWVIRAAGKTFLHAGDTLWHGEWWNIGSGYGPFDAIYMPINGAHLPGFTPQSLLPASLTPEQAVAAGIVMRAKLLTPIHYGFHDPDNYQEYPNALPTLFAKASERGMPVELVEQGAAARFVATHT